MEKIENLNKTEAAAETAESAVARFFSEQLPIKVRDLLEEGKFNRP